jgi:hypothetical protein
MKSIQKLSKSTRRLAIILVAAVPALAQADHKDLSDCAVALASPGDVTNGEAKACNASNGNGWPWVPSGVVNCATAHLTVPAGYHIVGTPTRGIRDNPAGWGMSWAAWLDDINVVSNGNTLTVSTQLKNWSTSPRNVCLNVSIESD